MTWLLYTFFVILPLNALIKFVIKVQIILQLSWKLFHNSMSSVHFLQ